MQASPILVFDGDCSFCSSSAHWVERRWPAGAGPRLVSSQSLSDTELEDLGLSREDVERAAWWVEGGRRDSGPVAVGRALAAGRGGWRLLGLALLVPPLRWLAGPAYALVARNRHRLPGGSASCRTER